MRVIFILLMCCLGSAQAESDAIKSKVEAALNSESRTEKEKKRDANRQAPEVLEFMGLKEDMKVIELLPGGGWYTKILASVLRDKGTLYLANNSYDRIKKAFLDSPPFSKVKPLPVKMKFDREQRGMVVSGLDFGVTGMDMVLTFRNYHNYTQAARVELNEAVFKALKPGGRYGIIDHVRVHMQPDDKENGRRVDPMLAVKEVQQAGFRLIDYSDLLYRAGDKHVYEVGHKDVTGKTDRFTLVFEKP